MRTASASSVGAIRSLPMRYPDVALAVLLGIAAVTAPASGAAQPTPYDVINAAAARSPIVPHPLRGGVTMLEGSGGNIGVLAAPDGLLMVDTGIAVSEAKIKAALRELSSAPLRTVILTHWHWDHSDGDGWVRRTGAALIAAPEAVQRLRQTTRIVEWGHTFTPVAAAALPNQLAAYDRTIAMRGERAEIRHYRAGHTDGDLSVYFRRADVLQTGDTFWNRMYPFIDYVAGGSIDGAIAAANENIRLAGRDTLVIPGHGPAGDRAALIAFRDMLVAVRGRVAALKARGMSLAESQAARPTASFDATWGRSVIDGRLFTALVYRGV